MDTRISLPGSKAAGAWSWPLTSIQCRSQEWRSYTCMSHSRICLQEGGDSDFAGEGMLGSKTRSQTMGTIRRKMENKTTRCHNPEEHNLNYNCCKILKTTTSSVDYKMRDSRNVRQVTSWSPSTTRIQLRRKYSMEPSSFHPVPFN
jgi:hypothetical protein